MIVRALGIAFLIAVGLRAWVRENHGAKREGSDAHESVPAECARSGSPREQARERRSDRIRLHDEGRLPLREWPAFVRRVAEAGLDDGITRLAAAQTYYSLMSLFPAMIVVVALLALIGQQSTTRMLLDLVAQIGPSSGVDAIRGPVEHVIVSRGTSRALLSLGVIISIFSASAFVGSFMWTANSVYEVDGRPFLKKLPTQIILAVALIVALALIAAVVVLTGPVAETLGKLVGLGEEAVYAYSILRWPLLFAIASLLFSLLYYFAPNVRQSKFRLITPGGFVGVVMWLLATGGFTYYVGAFGNYHATYGALAGIVVFIFWLWIFNLSLLVGLEVDVELKCRREELDVG